LKPDGGTCCEWNARRIMSGSDEPSTDKLQRKHLKISAPDVVEERGQF
jgi:hypothetical protein